MMAKNQLTPQVRVNKNGVPVTKHVKATETPSRALLGLPAPTMTTATVSPAETHTGRLLKVLEDIRTSAGPDYFHPAISDPQDDRLLCLLEDVSCDLGLEDRSFRKSLRAIVRMSTAEAVEKHLSAAAVLKGSIRPDLMIRFIAGMEKTEILTPYADRLNEAPPEVQEKARVLANAVNELCEVGDFGFNTGKKQFYITHPKLEAAVLANPERTREYAEFCASRGSADSLDEIDSVPTAVRSGIL